MQSVLRPKTRAETMTRAMASKSDGMCVRPKATTASSCRVCVCVCVCVCVLSCAFVKVQRHVRALEGLHRLFLPCV